MEGVIMTAATWKKTNVSVVATCRICGEAKFVITRMSNDPMMMCEHCGEVYRLSQTVQTMPKEGE
jgi:uncharacterized Zn finger protein